MINTCLIGFGYWGPNLARNFIGSGKYKINCICDKNLSKLNAAKKIYPNINIYKDYKKALKENNFQLVIIATPTITHFNIAKHVLQKKINVLVEKPLCLNKEKVIYLYKIANKNNVKIFVDYPFLYSGTINYLKKIILTNKYGKLKSIESYREQAPVRHDVNVIWDLGIHDVSIMNYLLNGNKVKSINLFKHKNKNKKLKQITFDLNFANGISAVVRNKWESPTKIRLMKFIFSNATIYCDENESMYKIKIYKKLNNFNKYSLEVPMIDLSEPLYNLAIFISKKIINKKIDFNDKKFNVYITSLIERINSK